MGRWSQGADAVEAIRLRSSSPDADDTVAKVEPQPEGKLAEHKTCRHQQEEVSKLAAYNTCTRELTQSFNVNMLEKIQRRATKFITGLLDLSYEEILKECG